MRLQRFIFAILLLSTTSAIVSCADFQEEEVPSFGVDVNELSYDAGSSLRPVTVSSGTKWSVASMPSWMSLQSIRPSGVSPYEWTASFVAEANDGYNREGQIVIQANTKKKVIVVSQIGKKGKYVAVESVSLKLGILPLTVGVSAPLYYEISPSDASDKSVTWSSSNSFVATVSSSGLVTAMAVGSATITVTTNDGGKSASRKVTVTPVSVTSVDLDRETLRLPLGETATLTATVLPENAANKSVSWSSSNTKVATVDSNGNVSAIMGGTAIITATTEDGGKSASCFLTVTVPVSGISLNKTSLSLTQGTTEVLVATITPSNASEQAVTWSSSNTTVATVSSSGLVTAKAVGSATITVTTVDGAKTANCAVNVLPVAVTGVTLNKYSLSLFEGDSETLIATVSPSTATNKNVTWSSNNSSVAAVNSYGQVTAKAAGTAIITIRTADGGFTATCSVSVTADPYGAVDLGLSVKWASFNYGASSVTATGGYYMWGDSNGTGEPFFFTPPSLNSISGTQYDIVRRNWGGNWRIPTRAEINELYSNCSWVATILNGVSVLKVTGRNGASIYLPFTGYGMPDDGPVGTVKVSDGNNAYMMSSESYGDSYGRFVYVFYFTASGGRSSVSYNAAFVKFPIRPVR